MGAVGKVIAQVVVWNSDVHSEVVILCFTELHRESKLLEFGRSSPQDSLVVEFDIGDSKRVC